MNNRSKLLFRLAGGWGLLTLSLTAAAAAQISDIAAHYVTTTCEIPCADPKQSSWYFWRGENRVEIRDANHDVGEIWRRDNKGRLSFVYIEPAHKRGIAYNATDLQLIHNTRPWGRLISIVSPEELKQLTLAGETPGLNHQPAQIYKGKIDNRSVEVLWMPALQLATRITSIYPDRKVITELKSLLNAEDNIVATSEDQLASYALVDFSDLGDMETNESMAWLKQATAAPGHETHTH